MLNCIYEKGNKSTMKKLFKLTVSLFICGLVLLSGCTSTLSTSLPSELRASNANYPKSVDIYASDFFNATGAVNAEEAEQKWLDEMSQRYGVNININPKHNFVFTSSSISQGSNITTLNTILPGLYSITTGYIKDYFLPLDDYLADNSIWNALPEDFKSLFTVDGHIYAIPASVSVGVQKARIIHDEAMEKAGITVTDLDSFRDFALAYVKKTTYPTGNCAMMSDITDILNAYGLYPGNDSFIPFSYDPIEDCYVDWLTKPAAVETLEYLRNLLNAKALYMASSNQMSTAFNYSVLASKYVPYYDYDKCTELLTLNPEYPQVLSDEIRGFAMTKGTPQPKETINFLIDMVFGSEENYLECWLGSSDNYVLNSDGTLTIKMAEDSQGNAVPPCIPNLTSGLSQLFPFSDEKIIYSQNSDGTDSNSVAAKNKARLKMYNDSLENGSLVIIPTELQWIKSVVYKKHASNVGKLYYNCCRDVVYGRPDQTVQQIVDEYKAALLDLGGNQMLDEMNAAIGKQTAYYYG